MNNLDKTKICNKMKWTSDTSSSDSTSPCKCAITKYNKELESVMRIVNWRFEMIMNGINKCISPK